METQGGGKLVERQHTSEVSAPCTAASFSRSSNSGIERNMSFEFGPESTFPTFELRAPAGPDKTRDIP